MNDSNHNNSNTKLGAHAQVILSGPNIDAFAIVINDDMGLYGHAGREILTGKPYDHASLEPIKSSTVTEKVRGDDGQITTVTRAFNNQDIPALQAQKAAWSAEKTQYERVKGPLWAYFMHSISPTIASRVRNDPNYNASLIACDNL